MASNLSDKNSSKSAFLLAPLHGLQSRNAWIHVWIGKNLRGLSCSNTCCSPHVCSVFDLQYGRDILCSIIHIDLYNKVAMTKSFQLPWRETDTSHESDGDLKQNVFHIIQRLYYSLEEMANILLLSRHVLWRPDEGSLYQKSLQETRSFV